MKLFYKFLNILEKNQMHSVYFLIILSLFGMFLETISIGLIMPLLIFFSQSNELPVEFIQATKFFGFDPNGTEYIFWFLYALIFFFILKFLFLIYLTFKQNAFVYNLQANLSTQMYRGYLFSSYKFHLKHNTTELIRNVIGEVQQFSGAVLSLLIFITEFFTLIGIISFLFWVEPIGATSSCLVLGLSGLLFDKLSKKHVNIWGKVRQEEEGTRLKKLNEGLNAFKEIKISSIEEIFISKFQFIAKKLAKTETKSSVLANTPRLGLELLVVITVVVLIFSLLNKGNSLTEILPTIGIFGAAAFRIMPSINRLINTGQVVRYRFAAIEVLEKEIKQFKKNKRAKTDNFININSIELENVSFSFLKNKELVLEDINLKIFNEEFVGIIGDSGNGKSTLLNLILGFLKPCYGQIKTNNVNIYENLNSWQNSIGYVPQQVYLIDDTIKNNIAFGVEPSKIDDNKLKKVLQYTGLENFVNDLPFGIETFVGENGQLLSGGQKQRIGIARALYNEPQILVLDEATNALDIKIEQFIIKKLRNLPFKPIILMVTHRKNSLSLADYILECKNKKVIKKIFKDI